MLDNKINICESEEDSVKEESLIIKRIKDLMTNQDIDGNAIPSYCQVDAIEDEFDLSQEEVISLAKECGCTIYKTFSNEEMDGGYIFAHPKCTLKMIKDDYMNFYGLDVEIEEVKDKVEEKLLKEYTTYRFGEPEYPLDFDNGEYDPHTGMFENGESMDDYYDYLKTMGSEEPEFEDVKDVKAKHMPYWKKDGEWVICFPGGCARFDNEEEAKKYYKQITNKEFNGEFEVDDTKPFGYKEEVSEDIEKHDELNPALFNGQELKPEVKDKLIEIANYFMDNAKEDGVEFDVKDILMVGSNANYNYTKDSDIDLHIVVSRKPECNKKEHLGLIYQAYKSMFNNKFDCTINGVPVEIYVEFEDEDVVETPTEEANIEEAIEYGKGDYQVKYGPYADNSANFNKFQNDVKEYPYQIIKTSDWYDPEGLNIPSKYTCIYVGTKEECDRKLNQIKQDAHNDVGWQDVEKESDTYVTIYYPHAIARATFKIVKNFYLDKLKEDKNVNVNVSRLKKSKLKEGESVTPTTPYMLRNDGELLKCGEVHPYIKSSLTQSFENVYKELEKHAHWVEWFKVNSKQERVKVLCDKFLKEGLDEKEFNELNDLTNQEFCRVRTSNYKMKFGGDNGEIYFRISSKNFNWFDLIWKVVADNKNSIKNVTVMRDTQSLGGKDFDYYEIKGVKLTHIDVDTFLTLSGNPVIEDYEGVKDEK